MDAQDHTNFILLVSEQRTTFQDRPQGQCKTSHGRNKKLIHSETFISEAQISTIF